MKIETKLLSDALKILRPIVGRRNTLPVLSTVRLEAKRNRLFLTVSDLDQYQEEKVECVGDLEPICVNFNYLVNALCADSTSITVSKSYAVVKCGRNEAKLPFLSAEEFPTIPKEDGLKSIGVACVELAKSVKAVEWCARKDEEPWMFKSVHVIGRAKSLVCEATDGRQLAVNTQSIICGDFEILLPADFVSNVSANLERKGSQMLANEDRIKVVHDGGFFFCKQMDVKYPNTGTVIPKEPTPLGKILLADALDVFSRCNNYTIPARTPISVMKFSEDGIHVSFSANAELNLVIPGKYKKHEANVNSKAFLMCLRGIKADAFDILKDVNMLVLRAGDISIYSNNITADFQAKPKAAAPPEG